MQLTPDMLLLVCPLVFLAGFVDAVAGGGGLISLPAYYLAGLPPALAAGTNKLAASMGTSLAVYSYHRSRQVDLRIGLPAAAGALVCSALGVWVMHQLPDTAVRWLVLGCIPIAAFFTLRGSRPSPRSRCWSPRRTVLLALLMGCATGLYDGLVGPGTGIFLILLLIHWFGKDAVQASGTAKVVNLASNVAALASLLATGDVWVPLGLAAGLCSMAGGLLGSRMTLRRGAGFIQGVMLVVLALLLAKLCVDMVH